MLGQQKTKMRKTTKSGQIKDRELIHCRMTHFWLAQHFKNKPNHLNFLFVVGSAGHTAWRADRRRRAEIHRGDC
jgi:hypothetical protein